MIAVKPSPVQPKFSFSKYDGITIGGQPFRYFETRENGHMFVKVTGEGVPQEHLDRMELFDTVMAQDQANYNAAADLILASFPPP